MNHSVAHALTLSLLAVAFASFAACRNGTAEGSGRSGASAPDISPAAPTFNQEFQVRNPRVCAKVTHVPSVAEATIMVQCEQESASNPGGSSPVFMLATDVVVQMGSPKPYNPGVDNFWDDIDPRALVYPLRGSSTGYTCTPVNQYNTGKNCIKSSGGQVGQGSCWHTQFNEWRCHMTIGGNNRELNVKGPTTF